MSEPTSSGESVHIMQTILDNQWLMLALGVLVPLVLYTGWGLWDILNIPPAP